MAEDDLGGLEFPTLMKHQLVIVSISLFGIAIVVGGVVYFEQPDLTENFPFIPKRNESSMETKVRWPTLTRVTQPISTTTPTTQSDITDNWKIYRNEKYGFEMKYSPKFLPIEDLNQVSFFEKDYYLEKERLEQKSGHALGPWAVIHIYRLQNDNYGEEAAGVRLKDRLKELGASDSFLEYFFRYEGKVEIGNNVFDLFLYSDIDVIGEFVTLLPDRRFLLGIETKVTRNKDDFVYKEEVREMLMSLRLSEK